MTDQQFQQLVALLSSMGSQGYEIALRQVQANTVVDFVWSGICLVVGIGLIFVALRFGKHGIDDRWDSIQDYFGVVFSAIFSLVALIMFPFLLTSAIQMAINPQWYAIQYLAQLVTGSVH